MHHRNTSCAVLVTLALLGLSRAASGAELTCPVIDLMPDYWRVVNALSGQASAKDVLEFRKLLVATREGLYGKGGLGFESAKSLDAAILRALDDSRRHETEIRQSTRRIEQDLPLYVASFKAKFQDFRCDFLIYIMHSLRRMDGAGRTIDGRPSLILRRRRDCRQETGVPGNPHPS